MMFALIFGLSMFQTITFAIASRARNRGHVMYNLCATLIGNVAWFLCFREVSSQGWDINLIFPYVVGAGAGSVVGVWMSEKIEVWLEASADGHIT